MGPIQVPTVGDAIVSAHSIRSANGFIFVFSQTQTLVLSDNEAVLLIETDLNQLALVFEELSDSL